MLEVVVRGAREFARRLTAASSRLDGELDRARESGARVVADAARSRAPRRSGRLAGSTGVIKSGDRVGAGSSVSYFWPVHSGVPGRGVPARPYVVEAADATESRVVQEFERTVDQVFRGV